MKTNKRTAGIASMRWMPVFLAVFLMAAFACPAGARAEVPAEDGEYAPDGFTWSGGTGKVEISCDTVYIRGGEVSARITFSSPYYEYVKVGEEKYTDVVHEGDTSSFEIPVVLNEEMPIWALTTRMSNAHEIEYVICVWLGEEPSGAASEVQPGSGSGKEEAGDAADLPEEEEAETVEAAGADSVEEAPELPGLTCESVMQRQYAVGFRVFYYSDGYKLIDIPRSGQYLVVPEGKDAPEGIPDMTVIRQPLDQIYMAATSVMSFYDKIGALDAVTMTGTDVSGWIIEAPVKALQEGRMAFCGKYSEPDYEQLVGHGCDLALESTMIFHSPEIQEMLESLGIPVFVDCSSYEPEAAGRMEWIRVYGALMNLEEEADAAFEGQMEIINSLEEFPNTGKTAAFFSINTSRSVVVRKSTDIIPGMLALAGGRYVFEDLQSAGGSASVNLSMEEFYSKASGSDFLIYNGTIETPLSSVEDLLDKDALFSEFQAVANGGVWQVDRKWYQSTAELGYLIRDFHIMFTGGDESQLHFLSKVN